MQDTGNVFKIKTHRMNIIKNNLQIINAGEDVEKREHSYTLSENVNRCRHYREKHGSSIRN